MHFLEHTHQGGLSIIWKKQLLQETKEEKELENISFSPIRDSSHGEMQANHKGRKIAVSLRKREN